MLNAPFEVVVVCVLMLLIDASATTLHYNIFLQIWLFESLNMNSSSSKVEGERGVDINFNFCFGVVHVPGVPYVLLPTFWSINLKVCIVGK